MAITVTEQLGSGTLASGRSAAGERRYLIRGTTDEQAALTALRANSPTSVSTDIGSLGRQNLRVEPAGPSLWYGVASYGPWQYIQPQQQTEVRVSLEIGGGTQHITQSINTSGAYGRSGQAAPEFRGAIGVSRDRVEGVDIQVASCRFTETHVRTNSSYTNAYQRTLLGLAGKVNNASFRGWASGEVLFLGASSNQRGTDSSDEVEISYTFAVSPNRGSFYVEDIWVYSGKLGWQYMWVRYEDDESNGAVVQRPSAVYIEDVYQLADFSVLGIGTAPL